MFSDCSCEHIANCARSSRCVRSTPTRPVTTTTSTVIGYPSNPTSSSDTRDPDPQDFRRHWLNPTVSSDATRAPAEVASPTMDGWTIDDTGRMRPPAGHDLGAGYAGRHRKSDLADMLAAHRADETVAPWFVTAQLWQPLAYLRAPTFVWDGQRWQPNAGGDA